MSAVDEYIDCAGAGAVLMVSPASLDDMLLNTDPADWRWEGAVLRFYRGAKVEHHDEWSWGWMVRKADGTYVEEAELASGMEASGRDPEEGHEAKPASPTRSEAEGDDQ